MEEKLLLAKNNKYLAKSRGNLFSLSKYFENREQDFVVECHRFYSIAL